MASGEAVRNFSSRIVFTNSPVLIDTGHFSWHMPSAAHMSKPAYSYSALMAASRSLPGSSSFNSKSKRARRLISRHVVILCLGVSAASLEGQLLSQNPHSIQASTKSWAKGDGFRFFLWTCGSSFNNTPGLSKKSGSNNAFKRHINA